MDQQELEDRLVEFAANIVRLIELLPSIIAGRHFAHQLVRSGTSPALNYGEARGAESRKDFIHKNKIILKELRETLINLKIIDIVDLTGDNKTLLKQLLKESDELVSIFVATLKSLGNN